MSQRDDQFVLWFPLGVLLGLTLTSATYLGAGSSLFSTWISEYQIIIGSIIAVITALWTIRAQMKSSADEVSAAIETANAQIALSQWIEERRREEKLRGARAILPFALTELMRFCEETSKNLYEVDVSLKDYNRPAPVEILRPTPKTFVATAFPESTLGRIQSVIESSTIEVARELGTLLTIIQIFSSRVRMLSQQTSATPTGHQILGYLIDFCELHARTSRCFDYSRFKSETISGLPLSSNEIQRSAFLLHLDADDELFLKMVQERISAGKSDPV